MLRIFLGAAPGVGKTFAMLTEAHRLASLGRDVVVGLAADKGRDDIRTLLNGLETIAPANLGNSGCSAGEVDVGAVLLRAPAVVAIDEYGGRNSAGNRNPWRWQDVEELLDAGVDVLTTVNIEDLASVAGQAGGTVQNGQEEALPDSIVRRADHIELIDISPELLRQRLAEGRIYAPDEIDAAMATDFRTGNLNALRHRALLWLADRVDEDVQAGRADRADRTGPETEGGPPARERIVVGLSGGPEGEILIRRAARVIGRVGGGNLLAVHVRPSSGAFRENPGALEAQRTLVSELGGSYRTVVGDDPARALLEFCRSVDATQLVLGVSRHRTLPRIGAGTGSKAVRGTSGIDVHLVPHPLGSRGPVPAPRNGLGRRRLIVGFVLALLLPPLVQLVLGIDPALSLTTAALVQLTGAVLVALIGGLWPGLLAAVSGSLLLNFFMTEPVGTLAVKDPQTVVALLVFVSVAATVAVVVDLSARRSKEAARARAEAATLSELTEDAIASDDALPSLIQRARETFRMRNVALFRRGSGDSDSDGQGGADGEVVHVDGDGGYRGSEARPGGRGGDGGDRERRRRDASAWHLTASAGQGPPATPAEGDNIEEVDPDTVLVLSGRPLPAGDLRLVAAFGRQLNAIRARQQLAASRGDNLRLAEGNRMRTSLLRAVSHDLRTPLAGIKLAVSSLRQQDVVFSKEDEQELLATIENYSDRLELLVGNLLDMSRITSDSVTPLLQPVRWHEVLPGALAGLPAGQVHVNLPPNMPPVDADRGMLERVIANVAENAVKYAPDSNIVLLGVIGGSGGSMVDGRPASELRVIDHGKGVAGEQVAAIFRPFQRLNDTASAAGIGLGLAVARGFTEAMGGTLTAEPTPGGGLTMVIRLPLSAGARP